MLYNLSWLQPGKPFPPTAEKARIQRYKENAQLFDNEHFESSVLRHRDGFCSENTGIAVYDECARRISRVIGNFENIISFPVLLNYQRLLTIKLADLVCGEFPSITGANEEDNKKLFMRNSCADDGGHTLCRSCICRIGEAEQDRP